MLRIYYCRTQGIDPYGEYSLSEYRRARLAALKTEDSRRESIAAELLLNHALRQHEPGYPLPAEIVLLEKGKPVLKNEMLHFSISHSGGFAACAVSDCPVGLDIQRDVKNRERLTKRYFHPAETAFIQAHPEPDYAFTMLWCMKESFVKMSGKGLASEMGSFCALDNENIYHRHFPGFHMAVCFAENINANEIIIEEADYKGSG